MAKNSAGTKNPSRIRFVMVEAELGDGDIGQITQAITNALRGPSLTTVVKRIAAPARPANGNGEDHADPEEVDDAVDELNAVDVTPTAHKKKTQRRVAPKPNVIPLDIDGEPPLSSLGKFSSNHKRYLAIARWLHDQRKIEVITQDHIYTCYRHLDWPTNIPDFAQPLRELKHRQYFESPEPGKFAINQLGLAKAAEASSGE